MNDIYKGYYITLFKSQTQYSPTAIRSHDSNDKIIGKHHKREKENRNL